MAPIMRQAIVSVEDQRFYEHNGVDIRGIARALWEDVRSQGVVEGGSTITQQYVKNAYVRNEQTIARKVREAALAWQLEQKWSKDRILLAYLNTIYFGNGAYGIQQAARTYFKKGAGRLTLAESALLAGLPADPSLYDPTQHPRAARARRAYVLQTMFDQGKITERQLARANAAPLPAGRRRAPAGHAGPGPVLRQLREGSADREVRRRPGLRRRPARHDDDRPRAAGPGPQGDREDPQERRRAGGRARRDRPSRRIGARHVRRHELPPQPVQPGHPGRAAARLVLQADRAGDGVPAGHLTADAVRLEARRDRRRRPRVARDELRGRLPGPREPVPCDGLVRQRRVRAADEARGAEGDRADGPRARHPQRARPLLLHRARGRRRQPARHDARVRDLRQRRQARRRLAPRRPRPRRRQGRVRPDREDPRERPGRESR